MSRLSRVVLATLTLALLAVPAMAEGVQLNSGGRVNLIPINGGPVSENAPIANPGDATYTTRTTLLVPNSTVTATSFTGGGFVATPSIGLQVRQVPTSWATWAPPPFTEGATPQVYFTGGATSLTLNLNQVTTIGGFELEPNPFSTLTYTAQFRMGTTVVETVTRAVSGSAGARLFAIENAAGFNNILITGPADFAIARLRFGGATTGIPEPATMVLLGLGLAGLAGAVRRHRKADKG
jgi:hypothetical protein